MSVKTKTDEILKKLQGKWVGLYYVVPLEAGSFHAESQYGILKEVTDDIIKIESLADVILIRKVVYVYKVVVRHG